MSARHHSSAPDRWTLPRPVLNASQRMHTYGPVLPMPDDETWPGHASRIAFAVALLIFVAVLVPAVLRGVVS